MHSSEVADPLVKHVVPISSITKLTRVSCEASSDQLVVGKELGGGLLSILLV